ncbi:hypothetical protein Rsub_11474 [Raphidocelis subcapitata]|uniref:Bromo domain-containing protein n=1 Tax=Raphidocelis subcapitata TaxID=307507 RepID=A0A2V0PLY0_9CHLO|nr:hypothetical protein Rsub_11474 [Raphidocelis subcapitata]|eukprot:GBF98870.1 hypothetical protein Rsub_11474 [Raphidocelis subcapitata]
MAAVAPPAAQAAAGSKRRVLLRLDDGSLIGDSTILLNTQEGGAVLLEPSNAARVARAGQPELERLDRLLEFYRNKYPNAYQIPKSQVRNHNPYREEGQRALKRQKSLPNGDPVLGLGLGLGSPTGAMPPGPAGYAAPSAADGDWVRKCWGVLQAIYSDIGPKEFCYNLPAKEVFYKTVSETFPGVAPQYYAIVRSPITFRDIEGRLGGGAYEGAQQFADDLRLLFDNAVTFTPTPTDPVHRLAIRLRGRFEEAWAGTGLCQEARGRRSNAGVARERFEHSTYDAAAPPQRKTASKQRDDFYRAASHEVSSYQEAQAPELPPDVMTDVANSIGELSEDHMTAALDLLNAECKVTNEEGEMELDFEYITYDALMRVDAYIREVQGLPPRPRPAPPSAPASYGGGSGGGAAGGRGGKKRGVQFDDTEDDDDYEEDDSDSD